MELGLEGKRALVTGSTAGIGFAAARALATEGAHVTVNGRSAARVVDAVARLRGELSGVTVGGIDGSGAPGRWRRDTGDCLRRSNRCPID